MVSANTKAAMKGSPDSSASTKCFSGILRSLLCTGSLPTHPSDQFIESCQKQIDEQKIEKLSFDFETDVKRATPNSSAAPGVVARLMGLDSFPDTPLYQKQRTLGSYFRSRSANSIDFFSQFDPIKPACLHRRVRTSVSFREVPSLLHDKFSVVFPLEEVYETGEYGEEFLTMKRPKNSSQQGKKEKWARSRNAENLEEKKVRQKSGKKLETEEPKRSVSVKLNSGLTSQKKELNSGITSQKKDFHGKTSLKLKEQTALPVQVLKKPVDSKLKRPIIKPAVKKKRIHSAVKKIHPESPVKEEVSSRAMYSNKHASTSKSKSQRAYSNGPHKNNSGENRGAIVKGKVERELKKEGSFQYKNMVEEIMVGLTQEISANEICCDWMYDQILNFEDFEDICLQFGQQILEVLLYQIVDELVLIYATRN